MCKLLHRTCITRGGASRGASSYTGLLKMMVRLHEPPRQVIRGAKPTKRVASTQRKPSLAGSRVRQSQRSEWPLVGGIVWWRSSGGETPVPVAGSHVGKMSGNSHEALPWSIPLTEPYGDSMQVLGFSHREEGGESFQGTVEARGAEGQRPASSWLVIIIGSVLRWWWPGDVGASDNAKSVRLSPVPVPISC